MSTQSLRKVFEATSERAVSISQRADVTERNASARQLPRQEVELRELLSRCSQVGGHTAFQRELESIQSSKKSKADKARSVEALRIRMKRFLESEATQAGDRPPPTDLNAVLPPPPLPSPTPTPLTPEPTQQIPWDADAHDAHDALLNDPAFAVEVPMLKTGGRAVVHDLIRRPELNGSEVTLLQFFDKRGRWGVHCVDGSEFAVRSACLTPLRPSPPVPAVFDDSQRDDQTHKTHTVGDMLDFDATDAQIIKMLKSMQVSAPFGRPFTREEAWSAAHESTPDAWDVACAVAHADGEPLTWDDIPERDKDWRNFM